MIRKTSNASVLGRIVCKYQMNFEWQLKRVRIAPFQNYHQIIDEIDKDFLAKRVRAK